MINLSKYPEQYDKIKADTIEQIKCYCSLCGSVYKERPFLCKCHSNVFLINCHYKNGEIIKDKKGGNNNG